MNDKSATRKYASFGPLICKLRAERGVSQKALALDVGITNSWLCALEQGRKLNITPALAKQCGQALNADAKLLASIEWAAERDQIMSRIIPATDSEVCDQIHALLEAITLLGRPRWPSFRQRILRFAKQVHEVDLLLPETEADEISRTGNR